MRWSPGVAMLVASTACASAPVARDFEDLANYRAVSFAEAWDVAVDVVGDRRWVIASLDRDAGVIATEWRPTDNVSYRDCGRPGFRATDTDHTGRFDLFVRETDNGVSVRVTSSWQVVRNTVSSIGVVPCLSTGALERELHDEIRARLDN